MARIADDWQQGVGSCKTARAAGKNWPYEGTAPERRAQERTDLMSLISQDKVARAPDEQASSLPAVTLVLANPRGFCAGVVRAIDIVERALAKYGAPVYVRHEIVHNRFVVDSLRAKGAVFVEELDEVPGDVPVIFSAHGVPKSVPQEAQRRAMHYIDATCPLVSKVHREAERFFEKGKTMIMIGHAGHPEVIGTMGQLPEGAVVLVETLEDVAALPFQSGKDLAFVTQTTLSVDDTAHIVDALKQRYPDIQAPKAEDICYATTNRQAAVKDSAAGCDLYLVVGAPNSSNSNRLVEVARRHGAKQALLVQRAHDLDWNAIGRPQRVGISAGASAPESLVNEVIEAFNQRFKVTIERPITREENVRFNIPLELREPSLESPGTASEGGS